MSDLSQYIHTFEPEYNQYGETYASPCLGVRGDQAWPGCNFYAGYTVVLKPHSMDEPHFHHGVEEYLIFHGVNLLNPYVFDAEIELEMGEDPDHMQTIRFDKPTVIRIPAGMWHCPINFKRVDQPVAFVPLYPNGVWGKVQRRIKADGFPEFIYTDTVVRRCIRNQNLRCSYCGACERESLDQL